MSAVRCPTCGGWFGNLGSHRRDGGCARSFDPQPAYPDCPSDATHCTHLWADNPRRYFCPSCSRIFGAVLAVENRWGDSVYARDRWGRPYVTNGPLAEFRNESVA